MEIKKITRKEILIKTGLKNEVFNRYYYNDIKKVDLIVVCKILNALQCQISEMIIYNEK